LHGITLRNFKKNIKTTKQGKSMRTEQNATINQRLMNFYG